MSLLKVTTREAYPGDVFPCLIGRHGYFFGFCGVEICIAMDRLLELNEADLVVTFLGDYPAREDHCSSVANTNVRIGLGTKWPMLLPVWWSIREPINW